MPFCDIIKWNVSFVVYKKKKNKPLWKCCFSQEFCSFDCTQLKLDSLNPDFFWNIVKILHISDTAVKQNLFFAITCSSSFSESK